MTDAERQRLRDLMKAKTEASRPKGPVTEERRAEIAKVIDDIAQQIQITQTGPDDYHLSAKPRRKENA